MMANLSTLLPLYWQALYEVIELRTRRPKPIGNAITTSSTHGCESAVRSTLLPSYGALRMPRYINAGRIERNDP